MTTDTQAMPAHAGDDLSTLAWVQIELRRSLDQAHKALRRYVHEAEAIGGSDVDAVDPAVLRNARVQIHQGVGALELVGQSVAAQVLRAAEGAVQRFITRPGSVDAAAVADVERAGFAVLDYLARLLAGKPVWPLALYPQYARVQVLAGAERVHPADLWAPDWRWRALPRDPTVPARVADDDARATMEGLVLALMRSGDRAAERQLSELYAGLAAGARDEQATLWQLAAACYEGLATGRLALDVHTKRLAARLLGTLRAAIRGTADPNDRLAQDLLFFCVRAQVDDAAASPRLAAVQSVWPGDPSARADYTTARLGLVDPAALQQAQRRLASARDVWSAVAGGEAHRAQSLPESFALLADSVQRLFPAGGDLAPALQAAATVAQAGEPPPALAMEVATSLLYLDAVLEDGELDQPQLADRVRRLAERVRAVTAGDEGPPLESWMEELYRRVSDRQTMGSVVQELRASLSEVEKQIDQYFREPAQRAVLIPVPAQLSAMRGVLSVLGLDQASQAVVHMRDAVDELTQTEADPHRAIETGTFDRLADNLGALSFLIDMLAVQPQLAKALFRFDAEGGRFSAVIGQSERTSAFADLEPVLEPAPPPTIPAVAAPVAAAAAAPAASGLEDDPEMREVFLEEAREVIGDARASLAQLARASDDLAEMTALRRAFHTLKGSSRMVGLKDLGEAAWGCEQLYNARLASHPRVDADLHGFTQEALSYLADWVEALAAGSTAGFEAGAVARAADALRLEGRRLPVGAARLPEVAPPAPIEQDAAVEAAPPTEQPEPAASVDAALPALHDLVPDLPTAEDLDLVPAAFEPAVAEGALPEVSFELDLEALDGPAAALPTVAADEPIPAAETFEEALPVEPIEAMETIELFELPQDEPDFAATTLPEMEELQDDGTAPLGVEPLETGLPVAQDAAALEATLEPESRVEPEPELDLQLTTEREAEPAVEPEPAPAPAPAPVVEPEPEPLAIAELDDAAPAHAPVEPVEASEALEAVEPAEGIEAPADDEQFKVIGPLRIPIPLFSIFLNEADEQSRRLGTELAEWTLEPHRPVSEAAIALAHSLAGNSGTVGYSELSALARTLEHALMRSQATGHGSEGEPALFAETAAQIRILLHQFAAGFLKPVPPDLLERLAAQELALSSQEVDTESGALDSVDDMLAEQPLPPAPTAAALEELDAIDVPDAIDADLFPIFEEEAHELLPQLRARLAAWTRHPADHDAAASCMRTLHTFKGGARLAGAMRVGELAHRLETDIERLSAGGAATSADVERLLGRADAMAQVFERLCHPAAAPAESAPTPAPVQAQPRPAAALPIVAPLLPPPVSPTQIDWSRFPDLAPDVDAGIGATEPAPAAGGVATVRVRATLLDRLVNQAGEISITRARIAAEMDKLQGSLEDLTENLDRLRRQLREIELQAETQISSRMEAAKASAQGFDPLELDRFTRFQELTRMMAESVADVATVHRGLQRTLQSSEDELALQARLARELQDGLLRTRMVEFESLADRLYRVVRQAAKETGKATRLDIVGGSIEVDRGVLERMVGPFEHLLRNSVAHGIEAAEVRRAAGKDETGTITINVAHAGNEVAVDVRDDGAGLDLARIRARAVERGLAARDGELTETEAAQLIFRSGFSTAQAVSGLAGRGVGMDVVRAEVNAMGGRIETRSETGQGTMFRLVLPLTTAVTQIVMLRYGERHAAVPSSIVELVRRVKADEIDAAYASGQLAHGDEQVPFFWLGALLQVSGRGAGGGRSHTVVVLRSASQRVAVHVEEVLGNQEVVVKNVGPQLSRLPGLAGVTLLPSGAVALIYNPVALATVYGHEARARAVATLPQGPALAQPEPVRLSALVMVVDDSLTVRRVTQRLLAREGYRVVLAKDGMEAIEKLADERPAVLLSDIEMPRMDGFDLVRNVRADARLAGLPVIMITSRIAQKHRDYAAELGVEHYLGKPYSEDELLALVARHAGADIAL